MYTSCLNVATVLLLSLLTAYTTATSEGASINFQTVPHDLDGIIDNSNSVVNGSVVLLFCSAIGDTAPPTISWIRDGVDPESPPLVHITTTVTSLTNLTSSVLTIRRFSPATAGLYECRASLQGTTIQSSINLTAAANSTLSVTRELTASDTVDNDQTDWRTYVTLDSNTQGNLLSCAAKSFLDIYPNVTWYKDGRRLMSDGMKVIITQQFNFSFPEINSSVSIFNFTQLDAGIYQCVFFTSTEVLTSAPLRLDTGPVSLTAVSPSLVYSSPPAPIVAEVYAQGEYSSILWSACNSTSTQYIINFGQTLVRTDPSPSDYGPYTASLDNSSNETVTVVVTHYELPNITYRFHLEIYPARYVLQGSNANITCVATGSPPPAITWTLNGQPTPYKSSSFSTLPSNITCDTIELGQRVSVLQITNISSSGNYTCNATNIKGSSWQSVYIEVQVCPSITTFPENQVKLQSNSISLTCGASGVPTPNITWWRTWSNGSSTQVSDGQNISIITSSIARNTTSTLTIQSAQPSDAGNYTCTATNEAGLLSSTFNVFVQVPPNITSPAVGFTYTVNSSDPVTFQCTASGIPPPLITFYNSYGPLSSDVDPRVIISDPITGSVTIGQQSVFTTSRNLTINSTEDGDSGNYTCEASNQGVATFYSNLTFQLVVQLPPTITAPPITQVAVLQSNSISLTCGASGVPTPNITWRRTWSNGSSTQVSDGQNISIITLSIARNTTSTLTIQSAQPSDAGNYTCTATNVVGSVSATANVSVQVKSQVIFPPPLYNYIANQTSNVTLVCIAIGIPPPVIHWYPPFGPGRTVALQLPPTPFNTPDGDVWQVNASLTVIDIQQGDTGVYTCLAANGVRPNATQNFTLFVQVPPSVSAAGNRSLTSIEKGNITISFLVKQAIPSVQLWKLQWLYSSVFNSTQPIGEDITNATNRTETSSFSFSAFINSTSISLTISNVLLEGPAGGPTDEGRYFLVATNPAGFSFDFVDLLVIGIPRITTSPIGNVLINGNTQTFTCVSYAYPVHAVTWAFTDALGNTNNLAFGSKYSITTIPSGAVMTSTLSIYNVQYQDSGQYNCTASNVVGTVSSEATLTVHVKPVVTSISNNSEVNISQPFNLQCIATGFPPPILSWSKNEADVPYGPSIFSVNLTTTQLPNSLPQVGSALNFASLQRNDTANYTCVAMNTIRTTLNDSQTSQLVILELPDPPINTTISQYGSRWLVLTWMAGFSGNKPITSFNIYGRNLNTSSPFQLVNNQTETDQYFYNISSGIAPFTNYSFTVKACNQLGCGQNGVVVFVFTLQGRPDTAPSNCSTNGNTSTSIGLQWLLPVIPNGVITSYNITYRALVSRSGIIPNDDAFALSCSNVAVLQNGRLGISELKTTLFPLLKATSYMFEIIAFTSAGEGPACQVNASTSDDVPEIPPAVLSVFSPNSTSIEVSWGEIPSNCRNGMIQEYKVIYMIVPTKGLRSVMTASIMPPSTSTVLTNLEKFVVYSVCVQARTSIDVFGNCSAPEVIRTLNDTADEPQNVMVMNIETTQLTVMWEQPTNPYGIITMYKIYYNSTTSMIQTNITMATTITLNNLNPGTSYGISVSAINGAGEGRKSPLQTARTADPPTSSPIAAAVASAVTVTFIVVLVGLTIVLVVFWQSRKKARIGGADVTSQTQSLGGDRKLFNFLFRRKFVPLADVNNGVVMVNKETVNPIFEDIPMKVIEENVQPAKKKSRSKEDPIPTEEFEAHVEEKHMNENWGFHEEYSVIQSIGEDYSKEHSLYPENRSKNRYGNILSYDHSRVILKPVPQFGGDYINANYLPGYTTKKEYIAAQGPLPDTLGDFWRMVWDNSVTTIVMLTNLQEKTKVKCTQYWPSSGSQVYANITVTHVDTSTFADFELRHLNIQANGSKDYRLVAQFHFVSWPDFGVPCTPVSLLHFLQRVRLHQPSGQPQPIVIHCSAGVGRTGTFLAIDVELQRAKAERVVNPFLYVKEMRKCRNLMVQTEDQYVFLHDAILEGLTYCDTVIPAEKLDEKVARLEKTRGGQTGYQTEFDAMKTPTVGPQLFTTATSPENQTKNLFSYALPYDYNLVHATHYINASCVDGFYKKAYYIAAQGPLQSSIGDFWRMIWDNEIQVIVMLSQLTEDDEILCPQYWPVNIQTLEKYDSITVELLSEKALDSYTVRSIKLTQQTSEVSNSMVIQHYHYQSWQESKAPESATGVVELCEQVMKVQRHSGNKPIVIHCSDGVGRTGALCAVMIAIDRLNVEGVVDIQHTIRLLRTQRPNMVRTPDQYRFIYRAVKEYVNSLSDYSNFK